MYDTNVRKRKPNTKYTQRKKKHIKKVYLNKKNCNYATELKENELVMHEIK